ncbi:MAG: MMPL family transporter [Saccharolobus sp.]
MNRNIVLLMLWLLLIGLLLPFAMKATSIFTYSDSPFLSNNLQSVRAQKILQQHFNIDESEYLYVLINSTYNQSLQEIYSNIYLLSNSTVITPYTYYKTLEQQYLNYVSSNESLMNITNEIYNQYLNLIKLKFFLISNFQYFEYQLNVTYWLPLHNFSVNICPNYKANFDKVNGTLLQRARYAGYLTFHDPYLLYFSFNNYTNYSLAFEFLLKFNNYSDIIYKIAKFNNTLSLELIKLKNFDLMYNNITNISSFHKDGFWLFIIKVPSNESLTSVEEFIQKLNNAYVVGHLAYYAQSAYYTQKDIENIDIATIILVTLLLIILIRSIIPILILVSSAAAGLVLAYGLLYIETFFGYKIYYISGLVAPPIVFGLAVDYGILFIYRYFEELNKGNSNSLKISFRNSTKAILISGLSITVGFLSFVFSPSELLRNIGISLVTSSVSALLPSVFLTYGLLSIISYKYLSFPRRSMPNINDIRQKYLYKLAQFSVKRNKAIVIFMILSIIILSIYFPMIHTNVSISEIIPSYASSLKGTKILENIYNYSTDYIILSGNKANNYTLIYNLTKTLIDQGNLVYGPLSFGNKIILNNTKLFNSFHKDNYTLLIVYVKYPVFQQGAINITSNLIKEGYLVGGANAQRIDIVDNTVNDYFTFTLPLTIVMIIIYLFIILGSIILPIRLSLTIGLSSLFGVFSLSLLYHSLYWLSPLIIFALLFSLGIDYDMFIVIRLFEEVKSNDIDKAIILSVEKTGLVVTACGLILSGAFFSLMLSNIRFLQEIGFGVGISIFFDTFIVRPILVPAIISILKKYNFWPFKPRKLLIE